IGVPEKDRDRVFTRYARGSNVSGIVGTGIGLYLVKMVIDLHQGRVAVESREGKGSRFTVRLPSALPRQEATRAAAQSPASAQSPNAVESQAAAE
ncbi:MAG: sensor histidine kinase, partial [Hyphomicrobiales bacterium]|nr:sensor histidine kinase [Hyphomicrobiales bacterium]MBV9429576.1 sensor histidine kinase [Bradyrhizobiaceae bacterium]